MNTAKQIRLFLTLSPQENDRLLAAYTAYVLEDGDHITLNQWARKQLMDKIKEL